MNSTDPQDSFLCPHCGAELRVGAAFCHECGASDDSGWNEGASWADGEWGSEYGEPDEDFDYDDYLRREFPEHASKSNSKRGKQIAMTIIVLLLCATFLLWSILM